MAYTPLNTGYLSSAGVTYTATTDNSSDWVSVPNDTRFFDFATNLVYYKDSSGNVISLFEPDAGGSVTSVGLTMPPAFNVANSPVTTADTINVTAGGSASQYIRGDGALADFPSFQGGGSAQVLYFNGGTNQGTFSGGTYYQLSKNAVLVPNADFSTAVDGLIAQFITDVNQPDELLIPAGNWIFGTFFNASSGGGAPTFYFELLKWDGATFTSICDNSATPETITGGTSIDLYFSALAVPETILTATDRLAVRCYVTCDGRTITFHTQQNHLSQVTTTFSIGLTSLNGLTDNTQFFATGTSGTDFGINSSGDIHTFNLPVASATNTGKLSASDWTTFNNKADNNIYTANGTLTANRILSMDGKTLRIENDNIVSGSFQVQIGEYGSAPLLYSLLYQDNSSVTIDIVDDSTSSQNSIALLSNGHTSSISDSLVNTLTNWSQNVNEILGIAQDNGLSYQGEMSIQPNNVYLKSQFSPLFGVVNVNFAEVQIEVNDGVDQRVQQTIQTTFYTSFCENTTSGNNSTITQTETSISLSSTDGVNTSFVESNSTSGSVLQFSDGVNLRSAILSSSGLTINNEYTFPNLDGSAGQFIQTDGAGNLSFVTPSSINIYNSDGTLTANRTLSMNSFNLLFDDIASVVTYDPNSAGGDFRLATKVSGTTGLPRFTISIPAYLTKPATGVSIGMRTWDDPSASGYGKVGDGHIYAGNEVNGLNIINALGTATEDYIRFYAGNDATGTANIHIQGNGATKGFVGINNETPTERLDVNGKTKTTTFQLTTSPSNNYLLKSDASGNGTWTDVKTINGNSIIGSGNIAVGGFNITTQSGASYSASVLDYVLINASTFTLTLPTASANAQVGVKMINATATNIQIKTPTAGVTIDGVDRSGTGLGLYNQYDAYTFISDGTNWFIVS